mmetsp:Transcript_5716/g.14931  ORF Transcript_5716/g.14931 Transcript_5716/m.14931 type:complete len:166 (-) Transcript_5716:43-540(-)
MSLSLDQMLSLKLVVAATFENESGHGRRMIQAEEAVAATRVFEGNARAAATRRAAAKVPVSAVAKGIAKMAATRCAAASSAVAEDYARAAATRRPAARLRRLRGQHAGRGEPRLKHHHGQQAADDLPHRGRRHPRERMLEAEPHEPRASAALPPIVNIYIYSQSS